MLNSTSLEVAIGLALVYLLMSILCTAINEAIAGMLSSRAKLLQKGIGNLFTEGMMQARGVNGRLLQDAQGAPVMKSITEMLYEHGLVQGLYRSGSGRSLADTLKASDLPSYIPSRTFATALFDLLFHPEGSDPLTLETMLNDLNALPESRAKEALLSIVRECQGDADKIRRALAAWFNDGMDRVSGWYKRRTQLMVFCIGLTLTLLLNVNSITLGKSLWSSPATRSYAIAIAQKDSQTGGSVTSQTAQQQLAALQSVGLPIGWNSHQWPWQPGPDDAGSPHPKLYGLWLIAITLFGWFITAMATTLGAPFWFDLLNQFMVVRSTIKPREKSSVESSKDPT